MLAEWPIKQFALLGALAALSACSETETTTETATEPGAEPAVAEAGPASWPLEPGTYEYTRSDGVSGITMIAADGTFSDAISGGEIETGVWARERGLSCLRPKGGDKRCYTFTVPDSAGNFTGTTTDGITAKIRKVA